MGELARSRLEACLRSAIAAVDGEHVVARALAGKDGALRVAGRSLPADAGVVVLAIGKAAVPMARAAAERLGGRLQGGLLVTRDGYDADPPAGFELRLAGHPLPDARSAEAGEALLEAAARVGRRDVLLVLLSGGASALTSCPPPGLDVADLVATTAALLACGADIESMNCLRKHLSRIAGGRLAAATRAAAVHVLALSDVSGDRLDVIGSGPCHGDPTRFADARDVVDRFGLVAKLPERVLRHLEAGLRGEVPESIAPGDAALERVFASVVARNADARAAALSAAGLPPEACIDLGEILIGEARRVGRGLVTRIRGMPIAGPRLLVGGGETVVTLRGGGRGGRSQELALAAALALADPAPGPALSLLAAGTDGVDGPTDAAGGFVDAGSVARARSLGLDPAALLDDNDSHHFLAAIDGLVRTGPTGTNVMDLVLVLAEPARAQDMH